MPNEEIWNKRSKWIEDLIGSSMKGDYMVSDQAVALFIELQACFCAGAWLSVVILSVSVIDSHLRETEAIDDKIGTAQLFDDYLTTKDDITWLRRLRNSYVHINLSKPALELNAQFDNRPKMELDAQRALEITLSALLQSPGI